MASPETAKQDENNIERESSPLEIAKKRYAVAADALARNGTSIRFAELVKQEGPLAKEFIEALDAYTRALSDDTGAVETER